MPQFKSNSTMKSKAIKILRSSLLVLLTKVFLVTNATLTSAQAFSVEETVFFHLFEEDAQNLNPVPDHIESCTFTNNDCEFKSIVDNIEEVDYIHVLYDMKRTWTIRTLVVTTVGDDDTISL